MDAFEYALQVTWPLSVAGALPRTGTGYFTPGMEKRAAFTPSNAQISATTSSRGHVAVNSKYKTEKCMNFLYTGKCKYGDKCIFVHISKDMRNSRLMNENKYGRGICKWSRKACPYGKRCFYRHSRWDDDEEERKSSVISIQPGLKSAPAFASEPGNAWVAPTAALVKNSSPKAQKPTAQTQKLSPTVYSFKRRKFNNLVGIYADWIDEEESFEPCLASEQSEH